MNGIERVMLDTNAIISLLKGNSAIDSYLSSSDWIATSVISFIEFLSFVNLTPRDKQLFYKLVDRITIIPVSEQNKNWLESIAEIRKISNIKLPDAIIAATAIYNNAVLITNDKGFSKIPLLQIASF
jgi:predicted nucleic acid-binding protein